MRLPLTNLHAEPPILDSEAAERAYCDEIARRLLEYERDPRFFLKKMRVRAPVPGRIV